jgi:cytochrome c-type biogenesis protein CcmH/NrfG
MFHPQTGGMMDIDTAALHLSTLHALRDGRITEAIGTARMLLRIDPTHDGARRNLIRGLLLDGQHAATIAEARDAIRATPDSTELFFLLGTALNALSRPVEARDALARSVALGPGFAPAWVNLGNALMDLDDLQGAEHHCRQALTIDPALIEAHVSLGFILTSQGRLAEGIAALEEALRLNPRHVRAHWNLATARLLAGDLPRGFAGYEWRKRHDRYRHDFINPPGPVWDGGGTGGDTILVHAEQGFGDTIQFARYLPLIAGRGFHPVLACEPSLIPLLSRLPGVQVVAKGGPLPLYDAWIDQMSLPPLFGTTLDTIPFPDGYLPGPARHPSTRPARIGLAWRGNPAHSNDRRRTPPPAAFAPLLARTDVRFVSLVPDETLPGTEATALTDHAATADVIASLDLVISVDTSVAHLAGAMGCPAWVLLPFAPDWRWLLNREDSPWYTAIRLFRQRNPGDWGEVMGRVIAALEG